MTVNVRSKDGSITLDLNMWTTCRRAFLFCNFTAAYPGCAFENLGEIELLTGKVEFGTNGVGDSVPITRQWFVRWKNER